MEQFKLPKKNVRETKLNKMEKITVDDYITEQLNKKREEISKHYAKCIDIINRLVDCEIKTGTTVTRYWSSDRECYEHDPIFKIVMDDFIKKMNDLGYHVRFTFDTKSEPICVYGDTGRDYIINLEITA
jgi:hypothetical protein